MPTAFRETAGKVAAAGALRGADRKGAGTERFPIITNAGGECHKGPGRVKVWRWQG
jgi:hypothetical protein